MRDIRESAFKACLAEILSEDAPPMAMHLGVNGDQIYRLAQEPAELLVVQHAPRVTF